MELTELDAGAAVDETVALGAANALSLVTLAVTDSDDTARA